jgi:hypothetical protein
MKTIRELISELENVENKDQVFFGDIWLIGDFDYEEDFDNPVLTNEEAQNVVNTRRYEKLMEYLVQELWDWTYEEIQKRKSN